MSSFPTTVTAVVGRRELFHTPLASTVGVVSVSSPDNAAGVVTGTTSCGNKYRGRAELTLLQWNPANHYRGVLRDRCVVSVVI